ncbi:MAG TPA: hypothetical protein PKL77_04590 [Candidatus Omnitrophota bacterium]|nr:hypothetical protein [Candidatus Omnitrophota bacterium]
MSFKTNAYRFLVKLHVIGILVFGSLCVADLVTAANSNQTQSGQVRTNTTENTAPPVQAETKPVENNTAAETQAPTAAVRLPGEKTTLADEEKKSASVEEKSVSSNGEQAAHVAEEQKPGLIQQITAPTQAAIQPITVNGDTVEYVADSREFMASGKVEVIYKGTKLNCDKLSVNADTKNATAEGHVRLEDKKGGIIEGDKILYNFDKGTGTLVGAKFRSTPFFGMTEKMTKVSEDEFTAKRGYMTTCNLDHPHWRMKSYKIDMFPGNKVILKGTSIFIGGVPILYLPQYNHSLRDPMMHVQVMPGKSKKWGEYMLTAWRYKITDNIGGNIFADYRSNLGVAEGFNTNYEGDYGKGDFKFYYTQERDKSNDIEKDPAYPKVFERYLARLRYKWDIDQYTNIISEIYKIEDSKRTLYGSEHSFLKDYFPREYEKDEQPNSYVSMHRSFDYSSLDLLVQKRINRWYPQSTEYLPQIQYNMPSLQLGTTPLYFLNSSQFANQALRNATPALPGTDKSVKLFDTTNRVSLPMKVSFINLTPFVASRQTFYNRDASGNQTWSSPRTIFSYGSDASTKFYRFFNVPKTKFWGMEFEGLRHIITPTVGYTYQHQPTTPKYKLVFDDGMAVSNCATLELSNKLQTKRNGTKVDFFNFRVNNAYYFQTGGDNKQGGQLSDFLYNLDIIPYAWMSLHGDATYKHSGEHSDSTYNKFTVFDADVNLNWGADKTFGFGQRYQRTGGNETTFSFTWRINPKWRIALFQRYQFAKNHGLEQGLREQEYTITRDLHCWTTDLTFNMSPSNGNSIFFLFKLKAFPELQFNFNQSYHAPQSGSQNGQ